MDDNVKLFYTISAYQLNLFFYQFIYYFTLLFPFYFIFHNLKKPTKPRREEKDSGPKQSMRTKTQADKKKQNCQHTEEERKINI